MEVKYLHMHFVSSFYEREKINFILIFNYQEKLFLDIFFRIYIFHLLESFNVFNL
jgi:hypothetical protein